MTNATSVAPAIATPPIVGVGWLCQRSGRGGTTAPIDADSQRITAPSRIEATSRHEEAADQRIELEAGVHQLATRSVNGASRSVMTNGRAPSTPSQSVSRPADAPGSSCCRRSSFSR